MRKLREIDADALSEFVHGSMYDDTDIDEILSYQPTIDAVPVVRCKDCKKSGLTEFGKRYCSEPMGSFYGCIPVEDNFFCSGGVRKDVEANGQT